jgi:hypothetical protein
MGPMTQRAQGGGERARPKSHKAIAAIGRQHNLPAGALVAGRPQAHERLLRAIATCCRPLIRSMRRRLAPAAASLLHNARVLVSSSACACACACLAGGRGAGRVGCGALIGGACWAPLGGRWRLAARCWAAERSRPGPSGWVINWPAGWLAKAPCGWQVVPAPTTRPAASRKSRQQIWTGLGLEFRATGECDSP